ncbi:serine/threonine-protein kinase [Spirosoma sp. SC4-14]|uniref:serine/threonine-protein kinase n=1 Tax=Spirosoma sp. SC4-14 TaxID=3128900 RepID=UPI0030CEC4F3
MPTVSVNTHFPGYEIIGEIGRSNARVLKARHLATGDLVAIKHVTFHTEPETLRRFRLESQLMTDIRHPNVVGVREVALDLPMPFIVMEWIEGGSLRTLLDRQACLDIPTVIRLGQQMAEAFQAIHPRGIIHRDSKPENILYRLLPSGEYHFLLTDFGIARLREQSHTITGQSLMTYEYASPEQIDNPRNLDIATDYYSLGVVLYECIAGQVPFSMANSAGIASFMNQVLTSAPPPLRTQEQPIPPSLDELVHWLLVKDPAQRLSDVNELRVLLGQANVEQWKASHAGDRPSFTRSRMMSAPLPVTPLVEQPRPPAQEEEPTSTGSNWNWAALAGIIVAAGIAFFVYYRSQQIPPRVETRQDDSSRILSDSLSAGMMEPDTTSSWENDTSEEETPAESDATDTPTTDSTNHMPPTPPADSTRTVPDSIKNSN